MQVSTNNSLWRTTCLRKKSLFHKTNVDEANSFKIGSSLTPDKLGERLTASGSNLAAGRTTVAATAAAAAHAAIRIAFMGARYVQSSRPRRQVGCAIDLRKVTQPRTRFRREDCNRMGAERDSSEWANGLHCVGRAKGQIGSSTRRQEGQLIRGDS